MPVSIPVVLLHGQPSTHVDWLPVRRRLPDLDILTPDRPGYGTNPAGPTDYPGNVDWLVRLLDDAGIDRAVVGGHSWGGGIATLLAARYPDRVAGLLLVCSVGPKCLLWEDHPLSWPGTGELLAYGGLRVGAPIVRRQNLRELHRRVDRSDWEEVDESIQAQFARPVWRSFVVEQRALVRHLRALDAGLGRIDTPTIVLGATLDKTIPAVTPRRLSTEISGAELRIVPDVGHLLPLDAPAAVSHAITDLLDRAGASAQRGQEVPCGAEPAERSQKGPCGAEPAERSREIP
jgi:pimeloyl-ACP methyl ester carboxylesterase